MPSGTRLFTRDFLLLNFVIFLTYCNIAVFFQFHQYLLKLSMPPQWTGFLIGIFAFCALSVRPVISPLLNPHNGAKWIAIGTVGVMGALFCYAFAQHFWSMVLVRLLHGAAYVVMATAVMARMIGCIPPDRSGQAFGMVSVITLLPYAVIPPLLEPAIRGLGGFLPALYLTALILGLIFPLLGLLRPGGPGEASRQSYDISLQDVMGNIFNPKIGALLVISLLVFTAFTPVFYFLKGYGQKIGISNVGWFFTLSTVTEIGVRLLGGRLLDRWHKGRFLGVSLIGLAVAYGLFARVTGVKMFYLLALLFGLCWGVALPLLNGLLFDLSEPRLRPLNANLGLEMFQGGFFLGPLAGGWILYRFDYKALFDACALMILVAIGLVPLLFGGKAK